MIRKLNKGSSVGDFLEGSEADFINKEASDYISKITKTGNNEYKITLKGVAKILGTQSIKISEGSIFINDKKQNGFRVSTSKGIGIVVEGQPKITNYFINDNKAYWIYEKKSWSINLK